MEFKVYQKELELQSRGWIPTFHDVSKEIIEIVAASGIKNGTVTICHSKTRNLAEVTRSADILVSAVGRANFVTADMVSEGAVVIDVGMNRDENGKLCGDVKYDEVEKKASAITPVPGGVGPMTIAVLMKNTLTAARRQNNL